MLLLYCNTTSQIKKQINYIEGGNPLTASPPLISKQLIMRRINLVIAVFFMLLFSGCIKEDLSNCPVCERVVLNFEYPDFYNKIPNAYIGIYDQNGNLVESRPLNSEQLQGFKGYKTQLDPGKYTAVCWGNYSENTFFNGFSTDSKRSDAYATTTNYQNKTTVQNNDALFFGSLEIEVDELGEYEGTIPFRPAYINFRILIKGIDFTSDEHRLSVRMNDLYPVLDFGMQGKGDLISYFPTLDVNTERALANFNVFRFGANTQASLLIVDSKSTDSPTLATLDIAQFVADAELPIEENGELTIAIYIQLVKDTQTGKLTIYIKPWTQTSVDPVV